MRAILLALRWRVQHLKEVSCRFIHLTDGYVCMSIISKGRSSSNLLMTIMKQIAAVQFSFSLFPVLIRVESTDNPTDEGSRLWPWEDYMPSLLFEHVDAVDKQGQAFVSEMQVSPKRLRKDTTQKFHHSQRRYKAVSALWKIWRSKFAIGSRCNLTRVHLSIQWQMRPVEFITSFPALRRSCLDPGSCLRSGEKWRSQLGPHLFRLTSAGQCLPVQCSRETSVSVRVLLWGSTAS